MQQPTTHILRIALLALVAMVLGVVMLQLDSNRTAGAATEQSMAASLQAVAPAPAPPASGQLVGDPAGGGATPSGGEPAGGASPTPPAAAPAPAPRKRAGVVCDAPHQLVQIDRAASVHASPGGRRIAAVPTRSTYLKTPMVAWVQAVSPDGRWGKVSIPWSTSVGRTGWIRIDTMPTGTTPTMVVADLSRREVTVYRGCRELLTVQSAIGRAGSPSPTGRFWVTDRVAVPTAQQGSFGTFAFGLSTIQPRLPQGWTGGNQMAIHGTGAPGSIGQAASAGCLRVSEGALAQLKPLLRIGTPVLIQS